MKPPEAGGKQNLTVGSSVLCLHAPGKDELWHLVIGPGKMNAAEHIVEAYYRICKKCFTMQDVKVQGGNNRQFDLLAVSLIEKMQFHIEVSITHTESWRPTTASLKEVFDKKFLGGLSRIDGQDHDFANVKNSQLQIWATYTNIGVDPQTVQRVWVSWAVEHIVNLTSFLDQYEQDTGVRVQVKSLRDEIIPELQQAVTTAHYDDEILRTFSLLKMMNISS